MKHALKCLGLAVIVTAASAMPAAAVDLKSAFQAALVYDAELLAAKASQEETDAGVPLARSALLPQLSYSSQRNKVETNTSYVNGKYPSTDSGRYDSQSSALSFRQALFRKPQWDALQGATAQAEAAEANYQGESQRTGLRAVASYLEVLSAREALTLAKNQTKAMEAWLTLAEKSFKAGRTTRTDIEDARSRRDMSRARETEANMLLISAARNFEVVSGIDADKIPETNPRRLHPELMLVSNKEQWLQRIEDSNPDVRSLRKQLEAAQSGVAQARAGHLPTLDLVAAHQFSESDTNTSVGVIYKTDYVGLQMNIPLISGGAVMAQTRQALAREERVRQVLESNRRKTQAEGNRLYMAIYQGVEMVEALKQAIESGEQAVIGEKKGIQAGTRTFVDALDAERRLFETLRDHALAIYSLANNRLKFIALAGEVDVETVETVSAWLTSAKL
jgi:TolC family type I secretion outer membrane protein